MEICIEKSVIDYILNFNQSEKGIRKIRTDLSKIYELIIVDKYMNNINLNGEFTMKDISKLNLELSNENKYRDILYT